MRSLPELMSELLGRPLDAEETHVLSFLSDRGIAKINHDQTKGRPVELTMKDLMEVFHGASVRRQQLIESLPYAVQKTVVLSSLNSDDHGYISSNGLKFLKECFENNPKLYHSLLEKDGSLSKDLDLESTAEAYLFGQLSIQAQRLAEAEPKLTVKLTNLVVPLIPTQMRAATVLYQPPDDVVTTDGSSRQKLQNPQNRVVLGLSPVTMWFDERQGLAPSKQTLQVFGRAAGPNRPRRDPIDEIHRNSCASNTSTETSSACGISLTGSDLSSGDDSVNAGIAPVRNAKKEKKVRFETRRASDSRDRPTIAPGFEAPSPDPTCTKPSLKKMKIGKMLTDMFCALVSTKP